MAHDVPMQQQATLGCGSLILIALVVLIFGNSGARELERDVRSLSADVKNLKRSVEDQTRQIKRLRDKLENAKPSAAPKKEKEDE